MLLPAQGKRLGGSAAMDMSGKLLFTAAAGVVVALIAVNQDQPMIAIYLCQTQALPWNGILARMAV